MEEIKYYYINGQIREHYYELNGQRHGEYKAWYPNGQLCSYRLYVNDKRHGEYKQWYDNGQLYTHKNYDNGKLHGEYKFFNHNEGMIQSTFWVHGKEVTKQVDKLVTNRYDITHEERTLVKLAIGC